jgi:glycerol-3-phosphate acyltransferase PlsX
VIVQELAGHEAASSLDVRIADAPDVVSMDEPPSSVLRTKRGASIRIAAEAVKAGEAAALFSAGHTGATVMASHVTFGLLAGVDRPGLAAAVPTLSGTAVLLDAGANVECRPQHLVQFGILGTAYARVALGIVEPRVGLLSIGTEATKGNDLTREAHRLLKTAPVSFIGNVEARDVFAGHADVIVCDGFTGNVALKVSEGIVDAMEQVLRAELSRTLSTRVGFLLARRAFRAFHRRLDYSEYGAAPLLGVAGLCFIGHGRSSVRAIRNGIVMTARLAREGLLERLAAELAPAGRPA